MAIDKLMTDPFRHAGGFQIFDHFLAIGIEDNHLRTSSKVKVYDVAAKNVWNEPLYTIELQGSFEKPTAGAVGIAPYKKEMLLAVANWDCQNIDFYACPVSDFKSHKGSFEKIASTETNSLGFFFY